MREPQDAPSVLRCVGQGTAPGRRDHNRVLDPDAALTGKVHAGLDRDDVTRGERVSAVEDTRGSSWMSRPDAVPGAVDEGLAPAGRVDDRPAGLVDGSGRARPGPPPRRPPPGPRDHDVTMRRCSALEGLAGRPPGSCGSCPSGSRRRGRRSRSRRGRRARSCGPRACGAAGSRSDRTRRSSRRRCRRRRGRRIAVVEGPGERRLGGAVGQAGGDVGEGGVGDGAGGLDAGHLALVLGDRAAPRPDPTWARARQPGNQASA